MSSTLARLGVAGAALVAAVGLGAAPAQAAGPLSIYANCEDGANYYNTCYVYVSGGTGPYAVRWDRNSQYQPGLDGLTQFSYTCQPRSVQPSWRVTVTDVTGAKVNSAQLYAGCNLNPT
ncbi:hypothetical protein [Longispora urticae]